MAIIKSFSPFQNLTNYQVFENDTALNSQYFRVSELQEIFTGGKNGFLIEGSECLKETTEVKIEILDVEGNPIYFEPGGGTPQYYEGNSKLIAVHVYDDTAIGIGKITILGELKSYFDDNGAKVDIPKEWKGVYNVKWERDIQINKNIQNETIVRFQKRPTVNVEELVKPIFTKVIPEVTQTGSLSGIPQSPPVGTTLSRWRAGTTYKLRIDDGDASNWTSSVDDNTISVSSLNYSPTVIEVLSNKEVLVDTPYTSSFGQVSGFLGKSYSSTFEFVEGQTITDSALTGSFAKINFNNLKTFVGDVARVKVFRKSRNTIGDFQFVQESKLESSELLKDVTTSSDTELSYGRFDQTNLDTYWITSSADHPVTINSDILNASVKTDYDSSSGGTQILSTSSSFEITSGIEYTLNFKTLLSGSEGTSQSIRAYFSGSNYEQNFLTTSGSAIYNTRQSVSQNILANTTANDTHLKFDITGGDWYISNVSLKNAQDTSFSPDEFTLIQDIPRKLARETFDFKFEFYDINNNYIPVDVITTKTFTGGNDFPSSDKLLTFESDRNAFRFSSGSIGNPPFQQIQFKTSTNNLTGSVTYASAAFDVDGAYINPSSYTGTYPGTLTNVTPAGAIITIANFSGSDDSITVGSIVYTSSIEELEEFETVYRLEDGDNAPQLIVTSNVNQFIYEPTTISPKPTGQSATIRAQRKNLFSLSTPIEVNSGSGAPPLSPPTTDAGTGIDTYTISALEYSASFAGSQLLETTYSFTGSDQFNIDFSDEITISPVINFDAVSIVLSNESTSFPANSLGVVSSNFDASKGKVQMFVGGTEISHDDVGGGRKKNTFDITSIVESNVTAISTSPTTSEYGISAFGNSHDSGSLTLNVDYLSGDSATSQSFQKVVSYTKSKTGVPNVEVACSPQSQTINSNSRGSGSVAPSTITVKATEGGTNRFTSIGTLSFSGGISGSKSSNTVTFTQGASDMISDTETVTIPINFTDSEGTAGTKNIIASFSRVKKGEPNVEVAVSPQSQALNANSLGTGSASPATITVKATEGGTDRFTSIGTLSFTGGLSGTISTNTITFSDTVSDMEDEISTVTIPINFTDGEGTTGTKTITANITRVKSVPPIVNISANPQAQSVASNADFSSVGTPSTVTITVNEGGSNYTYTTGTVTSNKYKITGVTNGTNNNNGTVTPSTPTDGSGTTSVVTLSYTNSEGTAFTSKTITLNVGVAAQGDDGSDGAQGPSGLSGISGLNFDVSPASQNITKQQVPVSFGIPTAFTVNVVQGSTTFSYDNSSPYSSGSFYIDNISNGTNGNNKTITPSTPNSLTAVQTTFDINYTDISGSSGTINKEHKVNVVVDGNTGPGIIHTGEWASGRNYLFSPSGTAGTARRDTVYIASSGEYYATTAQHTSTAAGVTGPPGTGTNWELLGTGDLFVAAKVGLFEDSFIQNTLNIGTNSSGTISASNITLNGDSTSPYISLGQSGTKTDQIYDSQGIFLGVASGTPKLSLKNASGNRYLKWDGSDLEIAGNIQITSGPVASQLNQINAATGSNASAASSAQSTANTANTAASNAQSTADGINANTGSLINPTDYSFGGDATFSMNALPASITTAGLYLGSNNLGYHNGTVYKSYMDNSGNFYLGGTSGALQWNGTTLSIEGNITITGGNAATNSSVSTATSNAVTSGSNAASAAQSSAQSFASTAAGNAATSASNAQATANTANTAASNAQDTANTAAGVANAVAAVTSSLVNPTTFTPTTSAGTSNGLHLGSNALQFVANDEVMSYLDSSGNFYLKGSDGGAPAPLSFNGATGVLTVTAGANIGGWSISSDSLSSATLTGGSDGGFTTAGITINSTNGGFISAKNFSISSAGVATFAGLVDSSAEIDEGAKLKSGTTTKAWNTIFGVDNTGLFLNVPRYKETAGGSLTTLGSLKSTLNSNINSLQDDIELSLGDISDQTSYNCVLAGTKIISKRGEINVEDTKEDDIIKIFNFKTKEWGWSSIDKIITNKVQGWSKIETELGKKLKCSNSHLLYHPDYPKSAIAIDELGVGGELYVYDGEKLVIDKIKSIETFDEEVEVWNYELDIVHNYVSNGILSHNALAKAYETTLSHQFKKNKSVSISSGDLVKLDSNNELQKVTTTKDSNVVGILWEKLELEYAWFGLKSDAISGSINEITPPPESFISSSLQDSFGNFIPTNETGSKEIWKVASIGDSVDYDSSGSLYTLQGFKMCNQGGNVVPGDLLCSSDTPGYLMKQPSEWVVTSFDGDNNPQYEERQNQCSYTVAKSMVSSSWDSDGRMENVYGFLYCG
jgi:hypothetical protein